MLDCTIFSFRLKTLLFSVFLCFSSFVFVRGQDDLKKYVNTMPPNVASFEKYGNIPISYNTGRVSEAIPLYDFEIDGNLHIPLILSYNNDGMKPDEVPTWVGHGWDFLPGGYIVQEIRGIDDFLVDGLANPNAKNLFESFKTGTMIPTDRFYFIKNALNGFYDSQQDVFSLNIMGKSTKFYFDGTEIKFIKYEPYKIELTADKNFEVTDEKGYKYIFGLKTGCSGSGSSEPTVAVALGGSSTWVLTSIILPDGSEVSLTYQQDAMYGTNTSSVIYRAGVIGMDNAQVNCKQGFPGYEIVNSTSGMAQQILQSISYKGRVITFNTIERNDLQTTSDTRAHALSSIDVKNENNQLVKLINFYYDNNLRLKLNEVAIADNSTNEPVQKYYFDYYQYAFLGQDVTNIPLNTSSNRTYAIDHWGYYNGATENTFRGVPKADYSLVLPDAGSFTGDNNRNANGDASKVGMLKRITYPTRGYTEFEYEPNSTKYSAINSVPPFLRSNVTTTLVPVPGAAAQVACPELEGQSGYATGTFTISQAISGKLTWTFRSTEGSNTDICSLTITEPDGTQIVKAGLTQEQSEDVYLMPGTYTYNLEVNCATAQQENDNIAIFSISQYNTQSSDKLDITVGGNRILRVKSYDAITNKVDIHRYEYSDPEFYQEPYYVTEKDVYGLLLYDTVRMILPYESCGKQYVIGAYNVIPFEGNVIYYRTVTEYLGANGENGKIVYSYPQQSLYSGDYTQSPYPEISNLSWRGGEPQKIEQYSKAWNDFTIQKSTVYTYTNAPSYYSMSEMTQGVKFGIIGLVLSDNYNPNHYSQWYNQGQVYMPNDRFAKASVTTTEYTRNANIVNVNNYYYNDNYFLPSKIQQINSKGQSIEKHLWYPGDYNTTLSNIATLQEKHMIGLPLKSISANNGYITSGDISDFDNYGNVTGLHKYESSTLELLPSHDADNLYPSKFNLKLNLSYNGMGKVKEYSPADNIPTAILWGYNNTYPIAKVTNATYQDLIDVLGSTVIDQLNSSSPGSDDNVRALLSQLRTDVRLKDKQVTTYTYKPLIGMTSQTDENNHTIYYEYDTLGRLQLIKDQDGNIIKTFDYHYQGQ